MNKKQLENWHRSQVANGSAWKLFNFSHLLFALFLNGSVFCVVHGVPFLHTISLSFTRPIMEAQWYQYKRLLYAYATKWNGVLGVGHKKNFFMRMTNKTETSNHCPNFEHTDRWREKMLQATRVHSLIAYIFGRHLTECVPLYVCVCSSDFDFLTLMVFISADVRSSLYVVAFDGFALVLSLRIACVRSDPYLFAFYVCTHMETVCISSAFTIIVRRTHKITNLLLSCVSLDDFGCKFFVFVSSIVVIVLSFFLFRRFAFAFYRASFSRLHGRHFCRSFCLHVDRCML